MACSYGVFFLVRAPWLLFIMSCSGGPCPNSIHSCWRGWPNPSTIYAITHSSTAGLNRVLPQWPLHDALYLGQSVHLCIKCTSAGWSILCDHMNPASSHVCHGCLCIPTASVLLVPVILLGFGTARPGLVPRSSFVQAAPQNGNDMSLGPHQLQCRLFNSRWLI